MNISLLNGFAEWINGIKEDFFSIFDVIPKIVYFLFASFMSGVDAMQALIRKLAGLDVYYTAGEAMTQKDPLTEFVYGILGIGNSSATYSALNTVFWSLAIFGLIVLVVTTMISMIKSHYSEDQATTNPWKYIYTAIKAILTFAIMPLIVVLGLQLSSFVLKTLDNITAGGGTEGSIKGIYGSAATEIFQSENIVGSDNKVYTYYDFFGAGTATSSTPFSGMLFKAASYNCNRSRNGSVGISRYQAISSNQQIFGSSDCQAYNSLQNDNDRQEYIAYQIDYAFENNLHLQNSISYGTIHEALGDSVRIRLLTMETGGSVKSFSKFNVGLVWAFYDLWQFNFIIAFGGGVTVFGIILSIIVALMSRLIKGAALFLIYPAILGIAPLDNFKAFKSWGTTFMQQVMMAFGSIIGMNIVLLLLPYIQNISFFNIAVIDAIINLIILIVALLTIKDFIGIVSGFVGGANATDVGGSLKGEIGGGIKKGAGITVKGGAAVAKTGLAVATVPIRIGKAIRNRDANRRASEANAESDKQETYKTRIEGYKKTEDESTSRAKKILDDTMKGKGDDLDTEAAQAGIDAFTKAVKNGATAEQATEAKRKAVLESLNKSSNKGEKAKEFRSSSKDAEKSKKYREVNEGYLKKSKDRVERLVGAPKNGVSKFFGQTLKWRPELKKGEDGKYGKQYATIGDNIKGAVKTLWEGFNKGVDGLGIGKTIADGFLKSTQALGESLGLDKVINGFKDIMGPALTSKGGIFDANPKKEGDALQKDIADRQSKKLDTQTELLKNIVTELKGVASKTDKLNTTFKASSTTPPSGGSGSSGTGGTRKL